MTESREQIMVPPCSHRGGFELHVPCNCALGFVAGFECALHDLCTILRPAVGAKWCRSCKDRESAK